MPTPPRVRTDDLLAAAGPHRVLTVARLRELGVPGRTISRRCGPGGPWTPLLRGVVLLATGTPTRHQRLVAAQAYGGPNAVITGFAATRAYGLARGPAGDTIHLLVPHGRHLTSLGPVIVERTHRPPEPWVRDGVRYASIERAVLDGARRLPDRDEVRAVVAEAVQRRRTTPHRLALELAAGSGRGTALVRRVLAEIGDGVRSAAEGWGRAAVRRSGLPAPVWNVALHGPAGFLARPDAYWPEVGLAWQIDSREWHLDPEGWAETLRRRSLLQRAGIVVVSSLPRSIRDDRGTVIAELEAMYALASSTPAPTAWVVADEAPRAA